MNEAKTRENLIDDELIKCGWNVKDITKVVEEYQIELDDDLPPFFDRTKRVTIQHNKNCNLNHHHNKVFYAPKQGA